MAVEGCPLAVFQSFDRSDDAYKEWEICHYFHQVCRMRRGGPLPDCRVHERADYVDSCDYWYLLGDFRPSFGFVVVFRGVVPGVYDN